MIQNYLKFIKLSQYIHIASRSVGYRRISTSRIRFFPVVPFPLADIGEGIAEVEVLQWYIKEGDKIAQFDTVCQVQSDKATVDITSRYDGIVKKIHYDVGDMAAVGKALIDIETDDQTARHQATRQPRVTAVPTAEPEPVETPQCAHSGPPHTEIESNDGGFGTSGNQRTRRTNDKVLTTPSVRRLAKEHGIDLRSLQGTGKHGRLMKSDVLDAIKGIAMETAAAEQAKQSSATGVNGLHTPDTAKTATLKLAETLREMKEDQVVLIKGIQRMMVKSMNAALNIPHFGYGDEVQMDALYELRNQIAPLAEEKNIKLSYLPFILKAASLALKRYPILNATVSDCESQYTILAEHNISVAMDTPKGLLVPNVKSVQNKSIFDIATELGRLQALGNEGKLSESDLKGGTFSISNIGSIGGTYMDPVILVPQVAIGAIGRIQTLPRFDANGNVQPVRIANVSWSGDHRVIDGATMARFSNLWKSYLENPLTMITELK